MNEKTSWSDRAKLYGITPDENRIFIKKFDPATNSEVLEPRPIFSQHDKGIEITPYNLDRTDILYSKDPGTGKRKSRKPYSLIRLYPERTRPDGSAQKYEIPKGEGTPPFIPPEIVEAYEAKKEIATLYITEGYFKAFKAVKHGLPTIGLVSITCMSDRSTGRLHEDLKAIVKECQVKRLVYLTDADCREISKDISEDKDLINRPRNFFSTINKFRELCSDLENVNLYFAHVSETITGAPKGLDDLYILLPSEADAITADALAFNTINAGKYEGNYFVKFGINNGLTAVRNYFLLNDVTLFYLHHLERRPELKGKRFKFYGTIYSYDEKEGKCIVEIPKSAADYFRVGDSYFEYVNIPNRYGELTKTYHQRQRGTIREDNGPDIFKHVSKYKAFCNVPDHINYQRIISNCFNNYNPFLHVPEPGDCDRTIEFIKHIFGTDPVQLTDGSAAERWQLGLDYLTILYKIPQQILPILCLVSKERQTGKTTFAKWLKLLFTENMAIVGNNDFENAFNAHWITKLLVCVDETKIDKLHVVEKIKSLSTSNFTMLNAKGKDQIEVETFLKFILLSNNEDNFINIDREEIRFWVIKVPHIPARVNDLENELLEEIPAFLNYLQTRKMITKHDERHWFNTQYLNTSTLEAIKQNSAPTLWKILRARIENTFLDHDVNTLEFTFNAIKDVVLRGYRYEDNYIKTILKDNGYTLGETKRGAYPVQYESQTDGGAEIRTRLVNFHGRAYTFNRADFTSTRIGVVQMELEIEEII